MVLAFGRDDQSMAAITHGRAELPHQFRMDVPEVPRHPFRQIPLRFPAKQRREVAALDLKLLPPGVDTGDRGRALCGFGPIVRVDESPAHGFAPLVDEERARKYRSDSTGAK